MPGDFYVDESCIDCDACRQIAPEIFRDHGEQSSVYRQPRTEAEVLGALKSIVACPTSSIGTTRDYDARLGVEAFPERMDENVYYCGFNSPKSYGGNSYFVRHPQGNWLVDSPKFLPQLVRRLDALGGVANVFLTHRDDVADNEKYARHFKAARVMHRDDNAARYGVERVVGGEEAVRLDPDLLVIPTPGHTRGHAVLLYRDKYLFTGDHLAWSPARQTLTAFRTACWYSWPVQTRSMRRLLDYRFEWVLPGHGRRVRLPAPEMRAEVLRLRQQLLGARSKNLFPERS